MSVKKKYYPPIGKLVEAMAAANFTQKRISELVPDVGRSDLDTKGGLYRADWQRGLSLGSGQVVNAYLKMASSGKCWPATKFWLATKGEIIEPKEVNEVSAPPKITVEFKKPEDVKADLVSNREGERNKEAEMSAKTQI